MQNNSYLYGDHEPMAIPEEVILDRLKALSKELDKQLAIDMYHRDGKKCNQIVKAIDFWTNINKNH